MTMRRRDRGWKVARRKLALKWQALTGKPLRPKKWVFVIGCYNSGTTLLANLLETHPEINGLPREGVELTDALTRPEGLRWPRMWAQCQDYVALNTELATDSRADRIKSHWSHHVDDTRLIVEKSIANMARLEFLATYFQPACFIYLIRNGYAAAEGVHRRSKPLDWGRTEFGSHYPMAMCAEQWRTSDNWFERQRPSLTNLLTISYESLTESATETLADVCDFLEIEPFNAAIVNREWDIHRVRSVIRNMNQDAIDRLSEEEIAIIEATAGDTLAKYEYGRPSR